MRIEHDEFERRADTASGRHPSAWFFICAIVIGIENLAFSHQPLPE